MIPYYEGFDYGGELSEAETHIKVWSREGIKTALIDADLLPYRVGYVIDPLQELLAKRLVESRVFSRIEDTPQFLSALESMCMMLNRWVSMAGCDSALLYITNSSSNFRLDIAFSEPYKGQRVQEKPPFFSQLKSALEVMLNAIYSDGEEADDLISIEAWRRLRELIEAGVKLGSPTHKEMSDFVIVSVDKDSGITPAEHYDPVLERFTICDELGYLYPIYSKKMVNDYQYVGTGEFWKRGEKAGQEKTKRVLVGTKPSEAIDDLKGRGLKFFYAQLIIGDVADNYKGLPNKGKTYAFELLDNCKSEKELYMAVLTAYKEVYGEGTHWVENYRGREDYREKYFAVNGCDPEDFEFWKGKGAYLTAYDRMLEQGRLAHMQETPKEIWRSKSQLILGSDKEFWKCK